MRRKTDMCMRVVVDSNSFHLLTEGPRQDKRLLKWITDGDGILCQPTGGGFLDEIEKDDKFRRRVATLAKSGHARVPDAKEIRKATQVVSDLRQRGKLKANPEDDHVLALVVADQAEVIVSKDAKLCEDVKVVPRRPGLRRRRYPMGQEHKPGQKKKPPHPNPERLLKKQKSFLDCRKCKRR